ncbi:MAG: carbon-nitrogen hydrolase family protein [Planctomycetes bacterium]|nr:carbon-nitrogen hydrolase family protein [Planctomycetota bacterium]
MPDDTLRVALVSDVFFAADGEQRLRDRLGEAKSLGAQLAVLPELPMNPWSPASKASRPQDAEPPDGPQSQMQAKAARDIGLAVLGGAIIYDPASGKRTNTALVFDADGTLIATYAKLHIPHEPGFWETNHYEPGEDPPSAIRSLAMPFGIQICSDINRPAGSHILAAQGAEAIIVPRATERATFERWRIVLQATAMTAAAYVLSVNRPGPEHGVPIGGPSIAVGPHGDILLETVDPVALITLDRNSVRQARRAYPGYLPVRASLYAEAWAEVARGQDERRP